MQPEIAWLKSVIIGYSHFNSERLNYDVHSMISRP